MSNNSISEEKKNLIYKRLLQGVSVRAIAEEVQVSERTVQRYKKSAPMQTVDEEQVRIGDTSVRVNYTTFLNKKEAAYTEKIKKELLLYDDEEEGWVFHLTKGDFRVRQSGCWWSAIVYPDSAPPNWVEALKAQGFRIAISPLHDKDTWSHDSKEFINSETGELIPQGALYKMGDRKKAHWHVIIVVDKRCGYLEMNEILQKITHCPYIQKCRSLRNAYDYFLHINAPEKYQGYDKSEIQTYNGFHVEPTKYECNILTIEMVKMIQEQDITEWCDCVEYFSADPEFSLILSTRSAYFTSYVKSRYYKKHPNIPRYTEVKQVSRFSYEKEKDEVD